MQQPRVREPMFTAPWPAVLLAGSIVLSFALQTLLFTPQEAGDRFGLSSSRLLHGEGAGLFTSLWVHANWAHVLGNAGFAMVCGPPVARLLGQSLPRALAFFLFYLVCGVIADGLCVLAMSAAEGGRDIGVGGASGAVSGLVGAAARTLDRRGRLGPIMTRTTVAIACFWTVSNLVIGFGFDPGATGGLPVAWPAHVIGFFSGLLLIGPWTRLFGDREETTMLDFPGLADR